MNKELTMEFTGERFVPSITGDIELEHHHRYFLALELIEEKRVLDIACGEGYGSEVLSHRAKSVIGVDIDAKSIAHARSKYERKNLTFLEGNCTAIPLPDASVDVVVSFETIEHHAEHEQMMREIKRVLTPNGIIVISSPDKKEYSDIPNFKNIFHVKELYASEFDSLLRKYFRNVEMYGQKVQYASTIAPNTSAPVNFISYRKDDQHLCSGTGILNPIYLIAIASDIEVPALPASTYVPRKPSYFYDLEAAQANLESAKAERLQLANSINELRQQYSIHLQAETLLQGQVAELSTHVEQTLSSNNVLKADLSEARNQNRQLQNALSAQLAAIQAIHRSRSWRMMAPLRAGANITRAIRRTVTTSVYAHALNFYRRLPLKMGQKQRIKGVLFSCFGFMFSQAPAYQQWKAYRELRAAKSPAPAPKGLIKGSSVAVNVELSEADGIWEWADYQSVRDRIDAIEKKNREAKRATPVDILELRNDNLSSIAATIQLPAHETPSVSILIPAYNNIKYTIECIASIAQHTSGVSYEVILADDASTDETRSIAGLIRNLRVISNEENLGFLRNCNNAASIARGRYILFLNNDVQVTPGWLNAMIDVFDTQEGVGAVGPKIIYPNGQLQEAGARWKRDGTAEMIGLFDSSEEPRFNYSRDVDYCSGACLLVETDLFKQLGGFDDRYAPAYCEDSDLCLQIRSQGLRVVYCPAAVIVHHLSVTSDSIDNSFKLQCIARNLGQFTDKWQEELDRHDDIRIMAFYLPQFHPIPENNVWWGKGFTEWTNVAKAKPNFVGHYQPRQPADLGFYDLRVPQTLQAQAKLAKQYGIDGFCLYYYWFAGKRLLEGPAEQLLQPEHSNIPFFLCWANENWTRRWDGRDSELLMSQNHSDEDDLNVIHDLMRYFRSPNYVRVNGKPLLLIYRVTLFPDFKRTAAIWRQACRDSGMGEIYIAMVESFELVHKGALPSEYGCDASVEFPPQELAEARPPSGELMNPQFNGTVADYRDLAVRYATRPHPAYTRFAGVTPGWDNTPRRQNEGFCFENSTPGAFQAWLETAIERTKQQCSGEERIIFVNAWNEWAEGAYLEPDRRYGHTFLEAVRNARDASMLMRMNSYALGQ